MDRVAVFVDAGYLFAQGSAALTGSKKPRASLIFDAFKALDALRDLASQKAPDCRLLRVYWYDGAVGGSRPTTDQALLANSDDLKLRLGFINSAGQQKGVDSLIVTDLIELARLKSISDAVLLSGDEDVRVGVQIAQNYGVRVHLLGIEPARGSQSHQLLQEADTTTEWSEREVSRFLAMRKEAPKVDASVEAIVVVESAGVVVALHAEETIPALASEFVTALSLSDIQGVFAYWKTDRGVPSEMDRKLLSKCRASMERDLDRSEIRQMRSCFQQEVKKRGS